MTIELEYAGFAEGATIDYRGNIALVGFAMPFLAVPSFPAQVAPYFIVIADDRESEEGGAAFAQTVATFRIRVEDPSGVTLYLTEQFSETEKRPFPAMPARLQMLARIPLPVQKPGRYTYQLDVTRLNETTPKFSVSKELNVVAVEDVTSSDDLAH